MKASEMPAPGTSIRSLTPVDQSHNTNKIIQITNFVWNDYFRFWKTGVELPLKWKKPRSLETSSKLRIVIENPSPFPQIPLDMDESGKLVNEISFFLYFL